MLSLGVKSPGYAYHRARDFRLFCCCCCSGLSVYMLALVVLMLFSLLHAFVLVPAASSAVLQYEVGLTYEYEYTTTVRLTEPRPGASDVTYEVIGPVHVTPVWQNPADGHESVLVLQFAPRLRVKPKGSQSLSEHLSTLDSKPHHPVAIVIDRGQIRNFYAASEEDEDALNLRRGVASLFQIWDEENQREEVDSSGKCNVTYNVSGKKIHKVKNGCDFHRRKHFSHSNKVLAADWTRKLESNYEFFEGIIHSVGSDEHVHLRITSLPNSGVEVQTHQKLKFTGQKPATISSQGSEIESVIRALSKEFKVNFIRTDLSLSETTKTCTANCKSLLTLTKEWKEGLFPKNLATVKAAAAFLKVVNQCRQSTKQEILDAIKATNNKKIQTALLEAIIAAQTPDTFEIIFDYLPTVKDFSLMERFLLAIAAVPRPTLDAVARMTELVDKQKVEPAKAQVTATLVLGSMLNKLCQTSAQCEEKAAVEAVALLSTRLQNCKDDDCYSTYLRALRNAALPKTIPFLLPLVRQGGKAAKRSLEVLMAMPHSVFTKETRTDLLRVFHQTKSKYDTTSRLMAADLLLTSDPEVNEVIQIVQSFQTLDETSTYLASRLKELSQTNEKLRLMLKQLLSNQVILGNYDVLSQPGISTAFTKLLAATSESNSTYGLHLELAKGGILKQSAFDVHINTEDDQLHLLRFGLYAGGLEALVGSETGGEPQQEEEKEEATAGMELVFFDVALRPYVFFVGQGELMGHVWSGTASELTPIARGNFLLHDYWQQMALQCGLVLTLKAGGALSADMSGSLKTSVWSRTAHSEIIAMGAMYVQSSATVDTSFIRSSIELAVTSEASLNFVTDSDFYEAPFKMCTQMNQPSFPLRYYIRKVEHIPSSKHRLRKFRKVSSTVNGRSFDLHPKNSALCHIMLNQ